MKKLLFAVLLSAVLSSLASAQTPTPSDRASSTTERRQMEPVKPEPSPAGGGPGQPRPRLAPKISNDLIQLDQATSEANKSLTPYIPPAVLAGTRPSLGGLSNFTSDARWSLSQLDKGMTGWAKAGAEDILRRLPRPYIDMDFFARGVAHYVLGKYDVAIAELDKAIQLNPGYIEAYNIRGRAYSGKGDYGRAIADYSEALRLKPASAPAYQNRAKAYEKLGDKAKAQADREKAAELEKQGRKP